MPTEAVLSCERFEELLYRASALADDEVEFFLDHVTSCPLGIHTIQSLQKRDAMLLSAAINSEEDLDVSDDSLWADCIDCPLASAKAVPLEIVHQLSTAESSVEARDLVLPADPRLSFVSSIRIIRARDNAQQSFVYFVRVEVATTSQQELDLVLLDSEGQTSSARVSSEAPSSMFVGAVESNDWASLRVRMFVRGAVAE